jgi:hypothetical protein
MTTEQKTSPYLMTEPRSELLASLMVLRKLLEAGDVTKAAVDSRFLREVRARRSHDQKYFAAS